MQNCGTVTICIGERIDISILTTMLVTKLGVPHVISRRPARVSWRGPQAAGGEVVYPEADMAVRIGKRLISGNPLTMSHQTVMRCAASLKRVASGSVRELDLRKVHGINVIAVDTPRSTLSSPDYTFGDGDVTAVAL